MKRAFIILLTMIIVCCMSGITNATLIDNLNGTVTQIRDDSTYGDGTTLMWTQDAIAFFYPYHPIDYFYSPETQDVMSLSMALDKINSDNYQGYSDWRYPSLIPGSTSPCSGFDCIDSDLGYMYYVELGNTMWIDYRPYLYNPGFYNAGPFNMYESPSKTDGDVFVMATEDDFGIFTWSYDLMEGRQEPTNNCDYGGSLPLSLWLVRVPEPSTILLVGIGLAGLIPLRKRRAKEHS